MKLNCKPGDLARVVKSYAGNEGKIVRCIELLRVDKWTTPIGDLSISDGWVTDPPLMGWNKSIATITPDSHLRPIRNPGDDAIDESHAWLPPVPQKSGVAA